VVEVGAFHIVIVHDYLQMRAEMHQVSSRVAPGRSTVVTVIFLLFLYGFPTPFYDSLIAVVLHLLHF
jgi:hypothetical protein